MLDSKTASKLARMVQESHYLSSSSVDRIIETRFDHINHRNSVGRILDVLFSEKVLLTLTCGSSSSQTTGTTKILNGALLFGRLFSYIVRMATLKRRNSDGSVIPLDPHAISYSKDLGETYVKNLAIDLLRSHNDGKDALWTVDEEIFHFCSGVSSFFAGIVTIANESFNQKLFISDISSLRDTYFFSSGDLEAVATISAISNHFKFSSASIGEAGGAPIINKMETDESNEVLHSYAVAHLLEIKTVADDHIVCVSGRKRLMSESNENEAEESRKEQMRFRRTAVTKMTTPHVVTTVFGANDEFSIQQFDVFTETSVSDAVYSRYDREQTRLKKRLDFLQDGKQSWIHGMTMKSTDATKKYTDAIDAIDSEEPNAKYSEAEFDLLNISSTVPIFINSSVPYNRIPIEHRVTDNQKKNYDDMSVVFEEIRRLTTQMYLLCDPEKFKNDSKEELKRAGKNRIPETSSFLRLINAGKENNGFIFNFDKYKPPENDANNRWLDQMRARAMCERMNPTPKIRNNNVETRALIRAPKLWEEKMGIESADDTTRVVAQYAYASTHEVGAHTAGVFVASSAGLYDDVEIKRWNLLYAISPPPLELVHTDESTFHTGFREYILSKCIIVLKQSDPSHERAFDSKNNKEHELTRYISWYFETSFNEAPDKEMNEKLSEKSNGAIPIISEEDEKRYKPVILLSSNHFECTDADLVKHIESPKVYNAIMGYRLRKRDLIKGKNPINVSEADRRWFFNAFGITPSDFIVRQKLCGADAGKILTPRRKFKNPIFKDGDCVSIFLNERMTMEFGEETIERADTVLGAVSQSRIEFDGIKTAENQLGATEVYMDALWRLLARMSAVGILNVDAHLGNYMITKYEDIVECKAIDFDAAWSTVLSVDEMGGDDPETPNKEGWKPLFVLNSLLVMFTLSQDTSRVKLYELFKNARRPLETKTLFNAEIANSLQTTRISQFTEIVRETMLALRTTSDEERSLPQKLLGSRWLGRFKGDGIEQNLKLPFALYADSGLFAKSLEIAFFENAFANLKEKNYVMGDVDSIYRKYLTERRNVAEEALSTKPTLRIEDAMLAVHQEAVKHSKQELQALAGTAGFSEYDYTIMSADWEKLMSIDKDPVFADRPPRKAADPNAVKTEQRKVRRTHLEWALRHNICWRSFVENLGKIHRIWSARQKIVNSTLDKVIKADVHSIGKGLANKCYGRSFEKSEEKILIKYMNPTDQSEYSKLNDFFNRNYKNMISTSMHHITKERDDDYNILDLMHEYVYTASPLRETTAEQKLENLLPRFPHSIEGEPRAWPSSLQNCDRMIMSILPRDDVPTPQ